MPMAASLHARRAHRVQQRPVFAPMWHGAILQGMHRQSGNRPSPCTDSSTHWSGCRVEGPEPALNDGKMAGCYSPDIPCTQGSGHTSDDVALRRAVGGNTGWNWVPDTARTQILGEFAHPNVLAQTTTLMYACANTRNWKNRIGISISTVHSGGAPGQRCAASQDLQACNQARPPSANGGFVGKAGPSAPAASNPAADSQVRACTAPYVRRLMHLILQIWTPVTNCTFSAATEVETCSQVPNEYGATFICSALLGQHQFALLPAAAADQGCTPCAHALPTTGPAVELRERHCATQRQRYDILVEWWWTLRGLRLMLRCASPVHWQGHVQLANVYSFRQPRQNSNIWKTQQRLATVQTSGDNSKIWIRVCVIRRSAAQPTAPRSSTRSRAVHSQLTIKRATSGMGKPSSIPCAKLS
jgi:hypothetical protein